MKKLTIEAKLLVALAAVTLMMAFAVYMILGTLPNAADSYAKCREAGKPADVCIAESL